MVRFVVAVVAGYLVMLAAVIGIFTVIYPMFGVERLFEPGSYQAARGWIALSLGIGLVAATAGGTVCVLVAPKTQAPLWLAAIVLVLGVLMAIPVVASNDTSRGGVRPGEITMTEAMTHARQPVWVALLSPLVGAMGVLAGAGPRATRR